MPIFLALWLLFGSCATAFAADKELAPTGLCIENVGVGLKSLICFSDGGDYTAEGTVDLDATEMNPIIERIESIETLYDGEDYYISLDYFATDYCEDYPKLPKRVKFSSNSSEIRFELVARNCSQHLKSPLYQEEQWRTSTAR